MNKKLDLFKKKIKHHTPEIIAGAIVVAGVIAAVAIKKNLDSNTVKIHLPIEAFQTIKDDGGAILFENRIGTFTIQSVDF